MMGRSVRARLLFLVLAVLAGVLVADRVAPARQQTAAGIPAAATWATMPTVAPPASYSSTWYCVGGTSSANGEANNVFELTNAGASSVRGTMSLVMPGAAAVVVPLSIPATKEVALSPRLFASGRWDAATFDFDAGGVGVVQTAAGPNGWTAAPCETSVSPNWYFAGGSTAGGSTLALSLYNPTATDAAVDLTFDTPTGPIEPPPPSYQGVVVPAGQVVVENIGDFVQQRDAVATIVQAVFGQVVAAETEAWSASSASAAAPAGAPAPAEGLSLIQGAPSPSSRWTFPSAVDSTGATVSFHLFNPSASMVQATFAAALASGSAEPISLQVPPRTDDLLVASTLTRIPANVLYSASVTTSGSQGLVVSRTVRAAPGQPSPRWGDELGLAGTATDWLLPAPGTPGAPGIAGAAIADVVLTNPGIGPVRVRVSALGGAPLPPRAAAMTIPAGGLALLTRGQIGSLRALRVSGTGEIVVAEDEIPAGMVGVVGLPGLPIA